jgi:uncharacterized protein (DUF433 family)
VCEHTAFIVNQRVVVWHIIQCECEHTALVVDQRVVVWHIIQCECASTQRSL